MPAPGILSRYVLALIWLAMGAALIAVPAWLAWTRWGALLNGHPVTLAVTLGAVLIGVMAIAWATGSLVVGGRQEAGGGAKPKLSRERLRRRVAWRISLAVPTLIVCLVLVAGLAWLRPFAATERAVTAMRTTETVRVVNRLTWFEMVPNRRDKFSNVIQASTALVLAPGARVDARAYAAVMRPLAEAGYLVIVLKEPFGISLTDPQHAGAAIKVHPEITFWAVGGHSLGGVAAAAYADQHPADVAALVLYGSYPVGQLKRADLKVISVSGTEDGLSTPADIEASKANLPEATSYVAVPGAVHAYFGDYGDQPGDGAPGVDRAKAQAQIVKATQGFLASLKPKKG